MSKKYFEKDITDIVEELLRKYSVLRDDDRRLVVNVLQKICDKHKTATEIFYWMAYCAPSFESITRARRRLQQLNPELRGKKWDQRHDFQTNVKGELGL